MHMQWSVWRAKQQDGQRMAQRRTAAALQRFTRERGQRCHTCKPGMT